MLNQFKAYTTLSTLIKNRIICSHDTKKDELYLQIQGTDTPFTTQKLNSPFLAWNLVSDGNNIGLIGSGFTLYDPLTQETQTTLTPIIIGRHRLEDGTLYYSSTSDNIAQLKQGQASVLHTQILTYEFTTSGIVFAKKNQFDTDIYYQAFTDIATESKPKLLKTLPSLEICYSTRLAYDNNLLLVSITNKNSTCTTLYNLEDNSALCNLNYEVYYAIIIGNNVYMSAAKHKNQRYNIQTKKLRKLPCGQLLYLNGTLYLTEHNNYREVVTPKYKATSGFNL